MKAIQPVGADCGCDCKKTAVDQPAETKNYNMGKAIALGLLGFVLWYLIYKQLEPFSYFFTYSLLGLERGTHLGAAITVFCL